MVSSLIGETATSISMIIPPRLSSPPEKRPAMHKRAFHFPDAKSLLMHPRDDAGAGSRAPAVIEYLLSGERIPTAAEQHGVRWHLAVDF